MLVDKRGKQSERQQLCARMADGAVMEWELYSDVMTAKNKLFTQFSRRLRVRQNIVCESAYHSHI